jgi:meiotically up-regulated gene 157 (Mug157) protein
MPAADAHIQTLRAAFSTGDIHAMWLRDSTNQVLPYLDFAEKDPHLKSMLCGVIQRQAKSVLLDPYSNAFNFNSTGDGAQDDVSSRGKEPAVQWCTKGGIFEQKYLPYTYLPNSRYN